MQLSQIPARILQAFANAGLKNTIPQTTAVPGAASFNQGFPPLTMTALNAGGIPPAGQDFNGILNAVSLIQQWQSAGGLFPYDATWSTANNGYPKGATLLRSDGLGVWFNTADNNTADPDGATPTGWVPGWQYGITSVLGLTNANVTLTGSQYGRQIIVLAGALTANVQIIFPALLGVRWLVIDQTTGAFSVTAKTAAGSGVILGGQGAAHVLYGDGTNIANGDAALVRNFGTTDFRANTLLRFANGDGTRFTSIYQQPAAGAAATSVFERRNGSNTALAQLILGDNIATAVDSSPTTSNSFTFKTAGSSAGLRFDNVTNSTGTNNIAFGWTNVSTLGVRIDGSNVGTLTPSDKRLKTKIKSLDYGSDLVESLDVYSFFYNQKKSPIGFRPGRRFGWIAQEVQEKAPELIHEWTIDSQNPEETTFLEIDAEQMVPILWNACRQLLGRVKALEMSIQTGNTK